MKPYVIKQGEYLKKLGHTLGFDADEVWNDPKNAELKELRKTPDVLCPGDILFVPDKPKPRHPFTAESDNAYVASVPKVKIRVQLSLNGEVLKDEPYVIQGLGDEEEKQADGEGYAEVDAPVQVREVLLTLPKRKVSYKIDIGGIDPLDMPAGQRMRLKNLGYYGSKKGGEDGYEMHSDKMLRAALLAFQRDQGLETTGEADDATKAALLDAHKS